MKNQFLSASVYEYLTYVKLCVFFFLFVHTYHIRRFPLSVGRNIAPDFTLIKKGSVIVLTFFVCIRLFGKDMNIFPYPTSKWRLGQDCIIISILWLIANISMLSMTNVVTFAKYFLFQQTKHDDITYIFIYYISLGHATSHCQS